MAFHPKRPLTRHDVAHCFEWAWGLPSHERTLLAAEVITWPALHLAQYPRERNAVMDRATARRSGLSIEEWLRSFDRKSRTHHRNFWAGCDRIAAAINLSRKIDELTLTLAKPVEDVP